MYVYSIQSYYQNVISNEIDLLDFISHFFFFFSHTITSSHFSKTYPLAPSLFLLPSPSLMPSTLNWIRALTSPRNCVSPHRPILPSSFFSFSSSYIYISFFLPPFYPCLERYTLTSNLNLKISVEDKYRIYLSGIIKL